MTDLSSLKKTIGEKTTEELQLELAETRSARRNFPTKRTSDKQKKSTDKAIGNASVDSLKELLKTLEEMQ